MILISLDPLNDSEMSTLEEFNEAVEGFKHIITLQGMEK
jgi:hypothetical protein